MKLYIVRSGGGSIVGIFKDALKACACLEATPEVVSDDIVFRHAPELYVVDAETDLA